MKFLAMSGPTFCCILVLATATGCADDDVDPDRTADVSSSSSPSASPGDISSPGEVTDPAIQAAAGTVEFTYIEPSGVIVDAIITYSQAFAANDPALFSAWEAITSDAPTTTCAEIPARDVVVVGSISFRMDDPTYPPTDLAIRLLRPSGGSDSRVWASEFSIHTGGGGDGACGDDFVGPDMAGRDTWGPVPIEYVIPDANGPGGFASFVQTALQGVAIQDFAPEGGLCNCELRPGSGARRGGSPFELEGDLTG